MKKFLLSMVTKLGGSLAVLAIAVTTLTANTTCTWLAYQEEMPEQAKKLRKF